MKAILAFGSLAVASCAALLLLAWPHAVVSKSAENQGAPFGRLASAPFPASVTTGPADSGSLAGVDRSRLLKLASYSDARDGVAEAVASGTSEPAGTVSEPNASSSALLDGAGGATRTRTDETPSAPVADPSAEASIDPSAVPQPSSDAKTAALASQSGIAININTASVDALDRLPGAGHIGRTIVDHRPYRSVDDLLHKRVLRQTAFQKIRSRIKVD